MIRRTTVLAAGVERQRGYHGGTAAGEIAMYRGRPVKPSVGQVL
jgi:hypothetical protein